MNIKSELNLNDYRKEFTEAKLQDAVNISTVAKIIDSGEDLSSSKEVSETIEHVQNTLIIGEIVDLSQFNIENEIINGNSTSILNDTGNMDYSPEQLVDKFLAEESALVEII
ncbi:14423_t:CDS:1 [Gigaspora margarita]|uniref:14423_t:CDS:1 n=1 Tax=Gigaspora margarita TaxID=4874 RepID=A0ABN7VZD5_GIGMA|nr:14423_t:CDS:1 [Gigaspora margarita]